MTPEAQAWLDQFLERAKREMFPQMKASTISMMLLGDPDPKLCLELGAAILFDKPILVIAPKDRPVPLALRTIAQKIVEVDDLDINSVATRQKLSKAIDELLQATSFRGARR